MVGIRAGLEKCKIYAQIKLVLSDNKHEMMIANEAKQDEEKKKMTLCVRYTTESNMLKSSAENDASGSNSLSFWHEELAVGLPLALYNTLAVLCKIFDTAKS